MVKLLNWRARGSIPGLAAMISETGLEIHALNRVPTVLEKFLNFGFSLKSP